MKQYRVTTNYKDAKRRTRFVKDTFHGEAESLKDAMSKAYETIKQDLAKDTLVDELVSKVKGPGDENLSCSDFAEDVGGGFSGSGLTEEITVPDQAGAHVPSGALTDEMRQRLLEEVECPPDPHGEFISDKVFPRGDDDFPKVDEALTDISEGVDEDPDYTWGRSVVAEYDPASPGADCNKSFTDCKHKFYNEQHFGGYHVPGARKGIAPCTHTLGDPACGIIPNTQREDVVRNGTRLHEKFEESVKQMKQGGVSIDIKVAESFTEKMDAFHKKLADEGLRETVLRNARRAGKSFQAGGYIPKGAPVFIDNPKTENKFKKLYLQEPPEDYQRIDYSSPEMRALAKAICPTLTESQLDILDTIDKIT